MTGPAGFWRRLLAYGVDSTLLALILLPLGWPWLQRSRDVFNVDMAGVQQHLLELLDASMLDASMLDTASPLDLATAWSHDPTLHAALTRLIEHLATATSHATAVVVAVAALYFIGFEASSRQATPGKQWLGLRVCTLDGQRPTLGRTVVRFLAGSLSWLSLNLGHALAAWTPRKQALHDLIAGTVVVVETQTTSSATSAGG